MKLEELTVIKPAPTPGDTSWFTHDRFGMFIHWGLYALGARHEWLKNHERIPTEVYDKKYFKHFDPDLYDPTLWADAAAEAGMKYFVITTKASVCGIQSTPITSPPTPPTARTF